MEDTILIQVYSDIGDSKDSHFHSKGQELLDCGISLWKKLLAESLEGVRQNLVVKLEKQYPYKGSLLRSAYLSMR